jgi:uncharacterized protein YfiM (DUF2279 family)
LIAHIAFALALRHPPDAWFGPDKLKHLFIGAFTQSMTYSLLQAARVDRDRALVGAWVVTGAVSVVKEVHDRRSYGLFSVRDLVWDAAGAGAATLIIRRAARTENDEPVPTTSRVPVGGWRPPLTVGVPSPILAVGQRPLAASWR